MSPRPTAPLALPLLLLLTLLACACGGESMEDKINRTLAEAVQDATAAAAGVDEDSVAAAVREVLRGIDSVEFDRVGDVEVLGFRELKALMPATVAGLARTKHVGESRSLLGLDFSQAEARYGAADGAHVDAQIIDSGGAGMLLGGMAAWTRLEVDKETETGSERTLEIDGDKAYEKTATRPDGTAESSLAVLVDGRYLVTLNGEGVTGEQLLAGYRAFALDGLPRARAAAPAAAE